MLKHSLPAFVIFALTGFGCGSNTDAKAEVQIDSAKAGKNSAPAVIDTAKYNRLLKENANGDTSGRWPAKAAYPQAGAILPFHRVVSYYGNLYSKKMGVLGEYPEDQMLAKLQGELKKWAKADTTIPVMPALHYIAVTAQGAEGKDGKYRMRMPGKQIDMVLAIAKKINAIVFLDVQVGLSNLKDELPLLEKYLSMPNVHLGIDPEFSMKEGSTPGKRIGTFDAADINYASGLLADIVRKNHLTPKILVVHRFVRNMVKDYKSILTRPEVQFVMDMDGWGPKAKKIDTYKSWVAREPVQFTGFKIFYHNDTEKSGAKLEMQPQDVLALKPRPIYIQYQ